MPWTDAEHAQILQQVNSLHDASFALEYASFHLHAQNFPQDAAKIEEIIRYALPTWEAHFGALCYLCDWEGTMKAGGTVWAMTRPQARDAGVQGILGASYKTALMRLEKLLTPYQAQAETITNGYEKRRFLTRLSKLQTAWRLLSEADAARAAFDASLAYAEPRPAENLVLPGVTREKTPMVGPHGDYRRFGEMLRAMARSLAKGWRNEALAAKLWPPFIATYLNDNVVNIGRSCRYLVQCLGLGVSVEHRDLVSKLDLAYASGTLGRPRQFFQVLMIEEILLNLDHLAGEGYATLPAQQDRPVVRGMCYDLLKWSNRTSAYLRDNELPREVVKPLADALNWLGTCWSELDNAAGNCFWLRYFMNTGAVPVPRT